MIVIVDYDTGNTRNVQKALTAIGLASQITADQTAIRQADGLILPGVGAFKQAMEALHGRNLVSLLQEQARLGKPILGVCLGMQLLLEGSMEYGYTAGLGLIPGICEALPQEAAFPVPHMGWNQLIATRETALTKGVEQEYVYFVHSYFADCDPDVIDAVAQYSLKVPAMISKGRVYGAQFHPEKSGPVGLQILENFKEVVADATLPRD